MAQAAKHGRATMAAEDTAAAVRLTGVSKAFGGNPALTGVTFSCRPGEIHALVGENGAGKSTLMSIASGALAPDEGEVGIGGVVTTNNSRLARRAGLAVAYQDDALIPDLSVADNLLLTLPVNGGSAPPPGRRVSWAQEKLDRWFEGLDAAAYVRELTVSQRQLVEIARAFESAPSALLLDEPTAALTDQDVRALHGAVRRIAADGTGVVYISHRLPEVLALAQRITVLRDGKVVAADLPAADVSEAQLVELMVGRSLAGAVATTRRSTEAGGEPVVEISQLCGAQFHDVDLRLHPGEIVGLAGIDGNGQRPLLRALAGLEAVSSGSVRVGGRRIARSGVAAARNAGVSFVSSDRKTEALIPSFPVRDNALIGSLERYSARGLLDLKRANTAAARALDDFDVRAASDEQLVSELSGGNAQKVALVRALLQKPKLLLIEEPTQGVDVGAKAEIYAGLRKVADDGTGVLLLSSDAIELAVVCDRVLVMSRGRVAATLTGDELTEERIVGAAVQATVGQTAARGRTLPSWRRFLASDAFPVSLLLTVLIVLFGAVAAQNVLFAGPANVSALLFLALPLSLAALAQTPVMLIGRFDLSVGPVVALTTVVATKVMSDVGGIGNTAAAAAVALALGAAVGLLNGALVLLLRINAVIATLATYILVQGIALLLAPVPGGAMTESFSTLTQATLGPVPVWSIVVLVLAILGEGLYRWWRAGLAFRALGSRGAVAARLSVRSTRYSYFAFVATGVLSALAGLFFVANTGVGDAQLGVSFTLASITAAVLGGLSTAGGRGSIVGPLVGAFALAMASNAFSFLNLPPQTEMYLTGLLTLVAIGLYSRLRPSSAGD